MNSWVTVANCIDWPRVTAADLLQGIRDFQASAVGREFALLVKTARDNAQQSVNMRVQDSDSAAKADAMMEAVRVELMNLFLEDGFGLAETLTEAIRNGESEQAS